MSSRRKPWPQPSRIGLALALVCLTRAGGAIAGRDQAISPNVAVLFVGQPEIVEGTVIGTQRDGNVVHLRFGPSPHDLSVSLIIGLLSDFPAEPERHYLGTTVRVAGRIRSFRGAPEIIVRDANDIRVVDADRAGASAPNAAADSPLRPLVDTLGERVRQLEDQMRRLGGPPASP